MIRLSFVLGASLSSRLIAWYGQGTGGFSHVDSVLSDGTLLGARSDWVGQIPPGVRVRPEGYEKWKRRAIVEIPGTELIAPAWEAWLRKQVGRSYDQGSILGFILGRDMHQPGHWICSACAFQALEKYNVLHRMPMHPSQITPDALFDMVTGGRGGRIMLSVGMSALAV